MRTFKRLWEWVDDLTGFSAAIGPIMRHPVPNARGWSWFYVLGSATLVAFMIQVATGIALATSYVASSGQAYNSLQFISSTQFGSIVRGIHYFGASAMVILIGLHTIRVYLMASYKYPRQINWLTGVGLLILTLLMAFTGQLLRFDQTGFWTVVIAAEQAGRTPFIGNWLGHFILAGDTVGGATLSRFYAAHVFFIPGLIFLTVGVHLYLVIRNGISEPPATSRPVDPRTYRPWYHALLARDGQPFWPDAAWRDVVFGVLVLFTIVGLAIAIGPPALGMPPDPTIVNATPRPDWYFLWYYAILSLLPRWSENAVMFYAPLIFFLCLILLPILAKKGQRNPFRRIWSIPIVAFIMFMIAYYGAIGHVAPWSPRMEAPPLPESEVGTATGPIAAGAVVFHEKGCEFCHKMGSYGGLRGPDLSYAGDFLTPNQITTRIYSGATNMPSYNGNITSQQVSDVIAFLESRHRTGVVIPPEIPSPATAATASPSGEPAPASPTTGNNAPAAKASQTATPEPGSPEPASSRQHAPVKEGNHGPGGE